MDSFAGSALVSDDIKLLASPDYGWDNQFLAKSAVKSRKRDVLDFVLSIDHNYNWNKLATISIEYGKEEFFDYIRSLAPPNYQWNLNWNTLTESAINANNKELLNYLIISFTIAPSNYQWNYLNLPMRALESGN